MYTTSSYRSWNKILLLSFAEELDIAKVNLIVQFIHVDELKKKLIGQKENNQC